MEELGRNVSFEIYNADGTSFHNLVIKNASYNSVVMSLGDKITGDVYYIDNTLLVTMQEYIIYNGVKYVLVNPPTIVREGMVSDNSQLQGMTKYSFEFYHPMYVLSNFPFTDIAVTNNEKKYLSQNKTFNWVGNLVDFINKLNANLTNTEWRVQYNLSQSSSEKALKISDVLSFDKNTIADALKQAYETWDIPFVITSFDGEIPNNYTRVEWVRIEELHQSVSGQTAPFWLFINNLPSVSIDNKIYYCKVYNGKTLVHHLIPCIDPNNTVGLFDNVTDTFYGSNAEVTFSAGNVIGQGKKYDVIFGIPNNLVRDDNGNEFVFEFGQGLGLKNNSRTPRNNKIVTRIIGYGSENNIPFGYPQIKWFGESGLSFTYGDHEGVYNNITISGHTFAKIVSYPIYKGIYGGAYVELIKHPFTRKNLMPSIYSSTLFNKVSFLNQDGTPNLSYDPDVEIVDYYDADESYVNPINLLSPSTEIHQFEDIKPEFTEHFIIDAFAYSKEYEDAISYASFVVRINNLIDAAKNENEIEQLKSYRDSIDAGLTYSDEGEEGGSYTWHRNLNIINEYYMRVRYTSDSANFNWVVVRKGVTVPETQWDDTMDDEGNYLQSYFKITLPQLDFDLYACANITEEMQINMRSGACIGCTFNVAVDWDDYKKNFYDSNGNFSPNGEQRDLTKYPKTNLGQVTLVVRKDLDTFGTLMPNIYQQPHSNDSFVILGISLPATYITNAEARLDDAAKEYMRENNVYYYDYPLKFDEHFLATHKDILKQISNNTKISFKYGNEMMSLFVKQMTIKFGESTLPRYDITLTDDIEIVLNQIGQVTEDVSSMRVQVSELQKYYSGNIIDAINDKLSKTIDDVCQGRITFQQGINVIGSVVFSDELRSPDFVSNLYTGRGWRIDNLGNAEVESLRVRSFLEIVELLVNRMQAQEGDTMFSDNDQIEKVDKYVDGANVSYVLSLKEKWDGYITSQQNNNILKGTINTLAAEQAGISDVSTSGEYYTSWMLVVATHNTDNTLGVNQIRIVLYGDSQVPAGTNFEPCELMTIARWGNTLNPNEQGITNTEKKRRMSLQSSFYISTSEGRIAKLTGVNKPILESYNYGTTLGIVPDFVRQWSIGNRLIDGRDYLYAQGVVVGDFIKVDIEGRPLTNYVDCGEWYDGGAQGAQPTVGHGIYLFEEKNNVSLQYETHEVWHNGALWRVKMHQPVDSGGVPIYYEPNDNNSAYWEKLISSGSETRQIFSYSNDAPVVPQQYDQDDEYLPLGWSNTPLALSQEHKNVYISIRKKQNGTWGVWSPPVLFSHLAEDGTSISITGSALKHYNTWADFEDDTEKVVGETYLVDENDSEEPRPHIVVWSQGATGSDANLDDAYIVQDDGQLYLANDDIAPWQPLGQIKGDKGDDGKNNAVISIYKRAQSIQSSDKPIGTLTYSFLNGSLSGNLNGWSTNIPSNAGGLPCWVRQVFVSSESPTITIEPTQWSDANRVIDDGVAYGFVFTEAFAKADGNGEITGNIKGYAYKYAGSTRIPITNTTIRYGYILNDSQTYNTTTTDSNGFFDTQNWFNGDSIDDFAKGSPSIFAAIEIGGVVVYVEYITISLQGNTGARGKVGRFFYFAGTFNPQDNDPTHVFEVNDAQAPYFEHTENGQKRYHVFNYETNGTYTMAQMWAISSNWNNKPWESMTNDFKYIITEAIFGQFAHLGSFIISGDYFISQYGTLFYNNGGTIETIVINASNVSVLFGGSVAYAWFVDSDPIVDIMPTIGNYKFRPTKCIDALSGEEWMAGGNMHVSQRGDLTVKGATMIDSVATFNDPAFYIDSMQARELYYDVFNVTKGAKYYNGDSVYSGGYYGIGDIKIKANRFFLYSEGNLNRSGITGVSRLHIILPPAHLFVGQSLVIVNETYGFADREVTLEQEYIHGDDVDGICLVDKTLLKVSPDYPYGSGIGLIDGAPYATDGYNPKTGKSYSQYLSNGIWHLYESQQTGHKDYTISNGVEVGGYSWFEVTAVIGEIVTDWNSVSPEIAQTYNAVWMLTRWEKK